jgi:hypothetical protein
MSLESVKAGDIVLRKQRLCSEDKLLTVERITKTQIVAGNSRYRRSDGNAIGYYDSWNVPRIIIPTFEQKEAVRIESAKKLLIEKLKGKEITALQVDAMMRALSEKSQ